MTHIRLRLTLLTVLSLAALLLLTSVLLGMQTTPEESSYAREEHTVVRTQTISASRGRILDRNGVPLVTNRTVYAVCFDYFSWSNDTRCTVIRNTLALLDAHNFVYEDGMPVTLSAPYAYTAEQDSAAARRMSQFLSWNGLEESLSAEEAIASLRDVYRIPEEFTELEVRRVLGVLFDMVMADFSYENPFLVASGVSMEVVSILSEQQADYPGVTITLLSERQYETTYAAHILGRTGLILAEDSEAFEAQGYPMDAIVGRDGVERAFESWLRGIDGERMVETGDSGGIVRVIGETPAQNGGDVYLTLDISLQKAAEDSLALRIQELREEGIEAGGGAAVVLDVETGDVLALASYPTYNLSTFQENYATLAADELTPMFNRAIAGTYAPGSTFKIVTAFAALSEGVITPETQIRCGGVYTYFAPNYLYHCWVYRDYGRVHGLLTASQALQESCNCFFYEAGRLTGIRAIDRYAGLFGLGEYTGIELSGEARGIVAGPDSRDGDWYAGDTLQAAIGQSDHLFTPLQLANYTATIANGGTHYAVHLMDHVERAGEILYEQEPEVLNTLDFSAEIYDTIREGMLAVTEDGTASTVFSDYPISVLGKSGSAQVGTGRANGIFILAAPAEDPEIAVAVVIEHGAAGNNAARVARDILTAYFGDAAISQDTP